MSWCSEPPICTWSRMDFFINHYFLVNGAGYFVLFMFLSQFFLLGRIRRSSYLVLPSLEMTALFYWNKYEMWDIKKIYIFENCFLIKCELCEIFGFVCRPFAEGPARYHWPRLWPMRVRSLCVDTCVWVYDQEHTVLPPAWLLLVRWHILNLDMVIYIFIWLDFWCERTVFFANSSKSTKRILMASRALLIFFKDQMMKH